MGYYSHDLHPAHLNIEAGKAVVQVTPRHTLLKLKWNIWRINILCQDAPLLLHRSGNPKKYPVLLSDFARQWCIYQSSPWLKSRTEITLNSGSKAGIRCNSANMMAGSPLQLFTQGSKMAAGQQKCDACLLWETLEGLIGFFLSFLLNSLIWVFSPSPPISFFDFLLFLAAD